MTTTAPAPATQATPLAALLRIPTDQIEPGPNARGQLAALDELAGSMWQLGQLDPLLVCELDLGRYQILDGHRRHAAAQLLNLPTLVCVLRRLPPPALRLRQQLAIHANARAFDPIAEAHALHTLMWEHFLSREQCAAAVGRTPGWVRDRLLLLQLDQADQEQVAAGRMPVGQALCAAKGRLAAVTGRATITRRPTATLHELAHTSAPARTAHCPTCTCQGTR
jgi:ParB family chromosome partitioning protein